MKNEIRDLKPNLSVLNRTQNSDAALRQGVANLHQMITHIIHEKPPTTQPTSAGNTTTSLSVSSCTASQTSRSSIHVAAWNCHGIAHAILYFQILAEQSNIIILTEHWLYGVLSFQNLIPLFAVTKVPEFLIQDFMNSLL